MKLKLTYLQKDNAASSDVPMCLSLGPGALSDKGRENKLREFVRENKNCSKSDVQFYARQIGMSGNQVNAIYSGFGWLCPTQN